MSLESASFIKGLVATNPEGTDPKSQGDDHLRLLKAVLQSQFSGLTDGIPIIRTETELNAMLLAGDFGLGGVGVPFTDANNAAGGFESGFYYLSAPGTNVPPGAAPGDTMLQIVATAELITQTYTRIVDGIVFVRKWQAAAWSAWVQQAPGFRQSNLMDLTPGALLQVGSFGLGGRGEQYAAINVDTVLPCTYFVAIQAGTAGTIPGGGVVGDMLLSVCFNAGRVMQTYWAMNTGLTWTRKYTGGWSAWHCLDTIGYGQTWQNVTASRPNNTTFQNQTGRPIQIAIGGLTSGVSGAATLTTDGGVAICQVTWGSASGNLPWSLNAIIPHAGLYQLSLSAGSINVWGELR